ncbi:unnamed protein product [Caenorhabditis nigoni]
MESQKPDDVPLAHIAHIKYETETSYNSEIPPKNYKDFGRKSLTCQVCGKKIFKTKGSSRKQHALHHLKLKTWKCTVCNRSLSHSDSGRYHFRSMHRDVPYTRLVETISDEERKQIDEMQIKCFPSKPIYEKRQQNNQ